MKKRGIFRCSIFIMLFLKPLLSFDNQEVSALLEKQKSVLYDIKTYLDSNTATLIPLINHLRAVSPLLQLFEEEYTFLAKTFTKLPQKNILLAQTLHDALQRLPLLLENKNNSPHLVHLLFFAQIVRLQLAKITMNSYHSSPQNSVALKNYALANSSLLDALITMLNGAEEEYKTLTTTPSSTPLIPEPLRNFLEQCLPLGELIAAQQAIPPKPLVQSYLPLQISSSPHWWQSLPAGTMPTLLTIGAGTFGFYKFEKMLNEPIRQKEEQEESTFEAHFHGLLEKFKTELEKLKKPSSEALDTNEVIREKIKGLEKNYTELSSMLSNALQELTESEEQLKKELEECLSILRTLKGEKKRKKGTLFKLFNARDKEEITRHIEGETRSVESLFLFQLIF